MLRVLLLLSFLGLPCSALQFGVVTPARLSKAVRVAAGNQTAHSHCTRDFARWTAALNSGERWAAEMADSWTKSVAGLLQGNTIDLGDFDECIHASSESATQLLANYPAIRGAYWLPSLTITSKKENAAASGSAQLLQQLVPLQNVSVALCVPDSCAEDLLVAALGSVAKDLLGEEGLGDAFSVTFSYNGKLQTEANTARPRWTHWAYLAAVAFLILLAVVATILDNKLDSTENKNARLRWRYLLHFSLSSGMRRLLAPAPPGSMTCINGLRVLSTVWIMAGHTIDFNRPVINPQDTDHFQQALPSRLLTSYGLSVDTFLAIAGLVCCMSFLRAANKTNCFNWIKYIIHRYARTTPAIAMVTFYGATWFDISYPAPDSFPQGAVLFTSWYKKYWWTSLLHISNFFQKMSSMMPHTWYISMDMQLYIAAPLVLIPLWKRPFLGKVLLALATLASCLAPAILSVFYEAKTAGIIDLSAKGLIIRNVFYYGTESRIPPYLVGAATGYFLYQIKYGGIKLQINRFHAAAMWILSAATALAVVFAPYSIETVSHPYSAVESFFYLGFTKLAWGVAISLVIIACETGWGGPVNKILSLGVFSPLGKLSFSLYLIHFFIVITDLVYVVHVVGYFSAYNLVRQVISSVTLTVPLAALLYLIVEQPFLLIETDLWK